MKPETLEVHDVVILSENKELQANLEKENITELVILDLKTKYSGLEISGLDDKEGYKKADEARKEVKNVRLNAEKIVKKITDKYYHEHKSAVADGKKVLARFTEIESGLENKLAVIDDEKKRLEAVAEQAKKEKNAQRVKDLQAYNYKGDLLSVEFISDEQFATKLASAKLDYEEIQAKAEQEKRLAKIESDRLEKQRIDQEAREKELQLQEKERVEAAAKIKAEQDRKEKEIADREAKLKAETEAHEKKIKDDAERIEREKKEAAIALHNERKERIMPFWDFVPADKKDMDYSKLTEKEWKERFDYSVKQKEKFDDEQKTIRDNELKEAEARASEKALKDAEEKRIADELAAKEKVEADKKEAERLEALKPIKEKMKTWVRSFSISNPTCEENDTVYAIKDKFDEFCKWAHKQVDSIS